MKLDLNRTGKLNQGFLDNATSAYKDQGLAGHTGIDYGKGYGKPVCVDNKSYVYKIVTSESNKDNWQAVYTIVDDIMEICFGHLSRIDVKEGQWLEQGQQIGLEGNRGMVFVGQTRITPEMQRAGSTEGSHVHESWRPVIKVYGNREIRGVHYMRNARGKAYKNNNHLYEIAYENPQTRGHVDPLRYSMQDTQSMIVSLQKTILSMTYALIAKLKKQT